MNVKKQGRVFLGSVLFTGMFGMNTMAAETPLEDGSYEIGVTLEGGSGRASVENPTALEVSDGEAMVTVTFSSPYYDYMLVDGEKYTPVNTEGNSCFVIPFRMDQWEVSVTADTVAMSEPHEIDYILNFDQDSLVAAEPGAGNENDTVADPEADDADSQEFEEDMQDDTVLPEAPKEWCGLSWEGSMELQYARQFQVNYYEGGYVRVDIANSGTFLLIPEDGAVPESLDSEVVVLQKPLDQIYLVATSAMDFFNSMGALDVIKLSGTNANGWCQEPVRQAMEEGRILFAGKYSAPDYELILANGCDLAIESTMIYHNPEVKEKLEGFGTPVLVERSSYERHPMGRSEWIKLYGALFGKEEKAEQLFAEQLAQVTEVQNREATGKTVAFFFISTSGYANVRKADDYVAKMIELAGGQYIFSDLKDDSSLSTVNMSLEEFYAGAKDADYIIYNSTIDGEISTIAELLGKSELLADFKAVKDGNVWCTGKNLFQETTSLGGMIVDIHNVLNGTADEAQLKFLHKVK